MDPGYLYFVVLFLNFIQDYVIDKVTSVLFGFTTRYGRDSEKATAKSEYTKSAQIVTIWFRGAFSVAAKHQLEHFLLTHDQYVDPRTVLGKDNVLLAGCTPTHAWFSITEANEDLTDVEKHPFMIISQFLAPKKLLIMSHGSLNKLAKSMDEPTKDREVIIISMMARCGSTLLCQIFNKLEDTKVLSEPWTLCHAHDWYNQGRFGQEEYETLVASLLKLQLKPWQARYKRIVLKVTVLCGPQVEMMPKIIPDAKHVLSVRHPKATLVSYHKFFQSDLFLLFEKYEKKEFWYNNLATRYTPELQKLRKDMKAIKEDISRIEDHALLMGSALDCILHNKKFAKDCVLYEDMTKRPRETLVKLLTNLDMDHNDDIVSHMLTALEKHSQNELFVTKGVNEMIPQEDWNKADAMFEKLGVPIRIDMTLQEFSDLVSMN